MKIILNLKKSWTGEGGARKTLSGVHSHAVISLHRKYTLASVLVSLQVRRLDSPLLSLMQAAERDIFCHLFSERLPKSHFGPWQFTPSSPLAWSMKMWYTRKDTVFSILETPAIRHATIYFLSNEHRYEHITETSNHSTYFLQSSSLSSEPRPSCSGLLILDFPQHIYLQLYEEYWD